MAIAMKHLLRFLIVLALFMFSGVSMAQEQPCSYGVEAALKEFLAGAADNQAVHERFWAEELIYTSSSGERFGKAQIMAGFEQNDEPTTDNEPVPVYSADEVEIRFENELALLTFTLVAETPDENSDNTGSTIQRYYNSGVLKNSASEGEPPHWRAVLWQATRIPEPAADSAPQHEPQ